MPVGGRYKLYQLAMKRIATGAIDFDTHAFRELIFLASSNCNDLSKAVLADLTDEHPEENGYVARGQPLTGITVDLTDGVTTIDADDVQWDASGGPIAGRYAVIIREGTVDGITDALVAVCLLDAGNHDVVASDGTPLVIQQNPSGIFAISGATED